MKVVIVGLGLQGKKRLTVAGRDVVATVDPQQPEATYAAIEHVPLDAFDAVLVCTPDQAKLNILRYLLSRGKHVLVEKPLLASDAELEELQQLAAANRVACYTAYNHRFEPHLVRLKGVLETGTLGSIYLVRGFYGNGTAADVRASAWRDQGSGVLTDLGSHLLDIVLFVCGAPQEGFELWSASRFENRAYDHVLFGTQTAPKIELEGALVSWRNTFTLDVYGARGSAHVQGLCKWGPSIFTLRKRVLPSGLPEEQVKTLTQPDPTWALEYDHFKALCRTGSTNLDHDRWINTVLNGLGQQLEAKVIA